MNTRSKPDMRQTLGAFPATRLLAVLTVVSLRSYNGYSVRLGSTKLERYPVAEWSPRSMSARTSAGNALRQSCQ